MAKWLSLFMALACSSSSAIAYARPNVLFLMSDDLNCYLGCYGDAGAKTPNLDRLAARGVLFERAYCTYPLCGPSRNSMLTGLYPNSTGIIGNSQLFRQAIPAQHSMPQAFRLAGYFAARIGKMFHYNVPHSIGTDGHDDPASWELELNPAGVDRLEEEPHIFSMKPGEFGASLSWYASPHRDELHTDSLLADDAEWVLQRCAKQQDRPFFVAVGFFRPHTPYVAPEHPYFDYFPLDDVPVVQDVEADLEDIPPIALHNYRMVPPEMTDDQRRQARQAYCASIAFMDAQVGRVLAALDRLELAENTIIVFLSDHGYHMGEHGLWQKRTLFEVGVRTPLLVVAPGVTVPGSVAAAPVSQIDLFPTLAELCNVPMPENVQGQSLVPLLKDPTAPGRGWALSQVTRPGKKQSFGYTLRTPRWRYIEWDEGRQGRELYDESADPGELTNLAEDSAHAATVAELSGKLRAAEQTSFPPSGKRPAVRAADWSPNLTAP